MSRSKLSLAALAAGLLLLTGCAGANPNNPAPDATGAATTSETTRSETTAAAPTTAAPAESESENSSGFTVVVGDKDYSDLEWVARCNERAFLIEGADESRVVYDVGVATPGEPAVSKTTLRLNMRDVILRWEAQLGDVPLTEESLDPANVVAVGVGKDPDGNPVPFEFRFSCQE